MQTAPALEQRAAKRFALALPITLEGDEGATHDLSATGILFEAAKAPGMGARIDLTVRYTVDGHEFSVACQGVVVRVERHGDSFNVAVQLHTPLFDEPG